nr:MAG TPA: hypothetical protein [Herelleviridae sp.]
MQPYVCLWLYHIIWFGCGGIKPRHIFFHLFLR